MNDPLFTFSLPEEATEDDILSIALELGDIGFRLWEGYDFTSACIAAGYAPETDGYNVLAWFLEHTARQLKDQPAERKIVVSNNIIHASLKFIAGELLSTITGELLSTIVEKKTVLLFEPEISKHADRIEVQRFHRTVELSMVSADFFVPNVEHMLRVPELLSVHMQPAVQSIVKRIDQMVAAGGDPAIVVGRRVQQHQDGEVSEYAEYGMFGIKVSTDPDPYYLRQRYFVELLIGAA